MPLKSIAATLLATLFHSAVFAHEVELMHFGGAAAHDVVIHVGPPLGPDRVSASKTHDLSVLDLAAALSGDFAQIGVPYIEKAVVPASVINVPEWMRSGVAASHRAPMFSSARLIAGCSEARYRPRVDLPAPTALRRAQLFPLIAAAACEQQIPVGLFDALIWQESRYQIDARSTKGAIGLAQLMPGTADYLGISDPWDVAENLRGGARYLRMQIDEFGRYDLALAAYNAGPGRVRAKRSIPPIRETIDYVQKITAAWARAESRNVPRLSAARPALTRNPSRGVFVADYTLVSVANPR